MTVRLEEGRWYRTRGGDARGPMRPFDDNRPFDTNILVDGPYFYTRDGKYLSWDGGAPDPGGDYDIVEEIDEPKEEKAPI